MPVEMHIDTDVGVVTFKVTGDLVIDEIRKALESLYADPEFRPSMHSLWELKEGHVGVTATQLPELIKFLGKFAEKRGTEYKVAIVVRGNLDFGLSTIFQMHAYTLPFEVKVYQSLTQAKSWLLEDKP
jgi:hypothetical protein